jgi:hypothetical protein
MVSPASRVIVLAAPSSARTALMSVAALATPISRCCVSSYSAFL